MKGMKKYVESVFNKPFDKKYYKKFMKITPKGKILDLGCGVGSASKLFTKAGYDYVGYDLDQYNIELGKQYNPSLNISTADITNIPNQEQKAKGAVYAYSLLTLNNDEITKSFLSCRKNLADGGNILIFARCKDFDENPPKFYVNILKKEGLINLLELAGFKIVYSKLIDDSVVCVMATKQ